MAYKVTTADIQKLRKATGAGLMDCKNALTEANGDFDKAVEIIRKKGKAIANKRADREAKEGVVFTKVINEGKVGAILALNCETDFVAKTEKFIDFAKKILNAAIETDAKNADDVKQIKIDNTTIQDMVNEQIGVIGEKIDIPYYVKDEAEYIESYVHMNNKLASLVLFNKKPNDIQIGKDICMQVVAMNPVALDKDDVPEEIKQKELEIAKEQAQNEGKPENIIEKIAMGRLNKFFQESTLLNQQFIKDHKKTVRDYIKENDKDLKVIKFYRFSLND